MEGSAIFQGFYCSTGDPTLVAVEAGSGAVAVAVTEGEGEGEREEEEAVGYTRACQAHSVSLRSRSESADIFFISFTRSLPDGP